MANAQLATSIFSRKPDEETIVTDVYKSTEAGVVNSYQDLTGTGEDLYDKFSFLSKHTSSLKLMDPERALEEKPGLLGTIKDAFSDGASKAKSLISGVAGAIKGPLAAAKTITGAAKDAMKMTTQAYTQINGVVNAVKNGNLKDLRNISNTLNSITGKTSVLFSPNGAVGTIFGTVVDQASAAGISDAFGVVAGAVKESSEYVNKAGILRQMATTSLPGALKRGDYLSVASMTENLGDGVVGMLDPTAVSKLAQNTKIKSTMTAGNDPKSNFKKLEGLFTSVDPKWNVSPWKPTASTVEIKDVSKLMNASEEVKEAFIEGAKASSSDLNVKDFAVYFAIKPEIEVGNVEDYLKNSYPAIPDLKNIQVRDAAPNVRPALPLYSVKHPTFDDWED